MFKTASLAFFLASATIVNANPEENPVRTLCYPVETYSDILNVAMDSDECTRLKLIRNPLRDAFRAAREAEKRSCPDGVDNELMALTNTGTMDDMRKALADMCKDARAAAANDLPKEDVWDDMNEIFSVDEFYNGTGVLNDETGNFQQTESRMNDRGGKNRFNYIGTDPRLNDHYPTSEESYQAGQAIKNFFEEKSKVTFIEKAPTSDLDKCEESNTAMCCWHRDRQYFDQNGNCGFADCANQNPGDNTDLCWTEGENGEVFPYPEDETENDLHCHGISWSNDFSGYDINTLGRWNTLFYVSMYDHLFKRGYVNSITDYPGIQGKKQPLCGCVEDMAPVARADCSEVVGLASYTATVDPETKRLKIDPVGDSFKLKFRACEGFDYSDLTREEFEAGEKEDLNGKDNDLSAFVYKQYLEGKIGEDQVAVVEETLVGYRDPDIQNSDKKRAARCKTAFETKFPDLKYEEVAIASE